MSTQLISTIVHCYVFKYFIWKNDSSINLYLSLLLLLDTIKLHYTVNHFYHRGLNQVSLSRLPKKYLVPPLMQT